MNTVRSKLVAPKDKTDIMDKSGVIYKIQCKDCSESYEGETKRNLRHRIKEHKRESSLVGAHLIQEDHQTDKDCVKILSSETKWFEREVKEAIHIVAERPSLNRDRGRHNLPAVYHSLVQSRGRECFTHESC
jgi:hypothetical protein